MTGVERPPYGAFQARVSPLSDHFSGSPFSGLVPSRFGPRQSGQSAAPACAHRASAAAGTASSAFSRILLIETPLVGNKSIIQRAVGWWPKRIATEITAMVVSWLSDETEDVGSCGGIPYCY